MNDKIDFLFNTPLLHNNPYGYILAEAAPP